MAGLDLSVLLILWMLFAITTVVLRMQRGLPEVGLVWAYLANLWLLHWPGGLIYLLPWYASKQDTQYATVYLGFLQSTIGVFGFLIGAALLSPLLHSILTVPKARVPAPPPDWKLPRLYIIIGIVLYLVIMPIAGYIPTATAIASSGAQLVVVGICLRCWHGWHSRNSKMFYTALIIAALIPLGTVVRQGFLGYGAAAVITILCFNGNFIRPRWKVAVASIFVAYFGFSAYVTYMRDRTDIRTTVWGGESMSNRIGMVVNTVMDAELINLRNPQHLDRIDVRLNQNFLVGAAVENLHSRAVPYARGETVKDAFLSLIPRALWPDKPIYAGSPDIVSRYTQIRFERGTSVGVGQVMEFFINFGWLGVFMGFVLLGAVIGLFDSWAAQRLWQGDWPQFGAWFLAGLGFIQAGGSLIEVFSTVGAGLACAVLINRHVLPALKSVEPPPIAAPAQPAYRPLR